LMLDGPSISVLSYHSCVIKRLVAPFLAVSVGAAMLASGGSPADQPESQQYSPARATGLAALSDLAANTYVNGALSSAGGPFMTDRFGRTIMLNGVNAVYKRAPYTLTVLPNQPNSLGPADAQRIASLGFNVVRLGVI